MKQEIVESMEWLFGLVTKYGLWVAFAAAIYFGVKRLWFWFIMPFMLLVTINMLGNILGWTWIKHMDIKSLIISWVFVFSLLSYVFTRDKK